MKTKGFFILSALALCGYSHSVQANQQVCVFDLLGKAGESYKFIEEWALMSKKWGAQVRLLSFQDEDLIDKAFQKGTCDAVYMTSMRARNYNKFAGSIDALGGVPNNKIARKAIEYVLDPRNSKRMTTTLQGQNYEVAGIGLIGSAYVFVKDRSIDTIDKARGKKMAILDYDQAQVVMVERIGGIPVKSDISNFVKKFNTGEADIVAAPAYAYKPLEIEKGLGSKGAMFDFPVVNITADLILRPEKFPSKFGEQSRQWFLKKIPQSFAMVQRLESGIPARIKMKLSKEDKEKYQRMLREGRIDLTKQGVYDPGMMRVLKKARCTVERTNFECSLGGE